jgi:hypothetical protein
MSDPSAYFSSRGDLKIRVRELKKTLKVHQQTRKRLKAAVSQRGCQQDAFSQLIRTRNEISAIKTHMMALKQQQEDELFKYMTKLNEAISKLQGVPVTAPADTPTMVSKDPLTSKVTTQDQDNATCAPDTSGAQQHNFGATTDELKPLADIYMLSHFKKSGSLEFIPLTTFCKGFEVWGKQQPGWKTASRVVCLECCEQVLKENRFTITRNTQIISPDGQRTKGDVINGIVRTSSKCRK